MKSILYGRALTHKTKAEVFHRAVHPMLQHTDVPPPNRLGAVLYLLYGCRHLPYLCGDPAVIQVQQFLLCIVLQV